MKETPVSNLERAFILAALEENKRIDGRLLAERRDLTVDFGRDHGCCVCTLGRTRVLAQASCSIVEPRATRPNEGLLLIHVDFTPMCAPRFVDRAGGSGNPVDEEITEVSRLLERLLKESRCLDMESLCISAEEKVWEIRLDIHVLNHEGNVADCAGVAGLAALAHFRRPDVSLEGDIVTIHPTSERDPIPLALHHYPVCSTFAFFRPPSNTSTGASATLGASTSADTTNGATGIASKKCDRIVICDPSHNEEAIMDGKLVLGMNPYKEICTLHLAGHMIIDKEFVIRLAHTASDHAKETVERLKNALARDEAARKETDASKERSGGVPDVGLAATLRKESILQQTQKEMHIDLAKKLVQSDQGRNSRVREHEVDLTSEDQAMDIQQNIQDRGGGVTEMTEMEDEDEDYTGMGSFQQCYY